MRSYRNEMEKKYGMAAAEERTRQWELEAKEIEKQEQARRSQEKQQEITTRKEAVRQAKAIFDATHVEEVLYKIRSELWEGEGEVSTFKKRHKANRYTSGDNAFRIYGSKVLFMYIAPYNVYSSDGHHYPTRDGTNRTLRRTGQGTREAGIEIGLYTEDPTHHSYASRAPYLCVAIVDDPKRNIFTDTNRSYSFENAKDKLTGLSIDMLGKTPEDLRARLDEWVLSNPAFWHLPRKLREPKTPWSKLTSSR